MEDDNRLLDDTWAGYVQTDANLIVSTYNGMLNSSELSRGSFTDQNTAFSLR